VQHVSILGYVQPITAPLCAFAFLGEAASVWATPGGTLDVGAGTLVMREGRQ